MGNEQACPIWIYKLISRKGGRARTSEIFCGSGVKDSVIDWHSCQHRSIAGCTKDVRGVRMRSEREKVNSILKALVSCDGGFDLLMNMFFCFYYILKKYLY